jgi:hypothetical protein
MGFGARGVAMSNALVADAFGDASPYYNPALAPFAAGQTLEASAALLSLDRELQFLQFSAPLRPVAGVAVGLIHAGVSRIDGRDASGYHTRNYSTDEFAVFLAFGTRLSSSVSAGVGLQLFRADFIEDVRPLNSIGIDVGVTVRASEALRLGVAVDDILARYAWDTSGLYGTDGKRTTDRFPVRIRLGGAYRLLDGRAQVVAEYESRIRSAELRSRSVQLIGDVPREVTSTESYRLHDASVRVGAEYRPAEIFAVRAGLDRIAEDGMGPSAGFMIEQPVGRIRLRGEYAFVVEPHATGSMHLVTLRLHL